MVYKTSMAQVQVDVKGQEAEEMIEYSCINGHKIAIPASFDEYCTFKVNQGEVTRTSMLCLICLLDELEQMRIPRLYPSRRFTKEG